MKATTCLLISFVILLSVTFSGCCGGGSKETTVVATPSSTTTVGQELTDLKKAHDEGAITDEEYEIQKEKILKSK